MTMRLSGCSDSENTSADVSTPATSGSKPGTVIGWLPAAITAYSKVIRSEVSTAPFRTMTTFGASNVTVIL